MPFLDQLKRGVDVTKFKADQMMRINRVQNEIGDLRREITTTRDQIASAAIQLHKQSALSYSELEESCVKIDQLEARIAEKDAQIAAIRSEVPPQALPPTSLTPAYAPPTPAGSAQPSNACPHCGYGAPADAMFCPNCGKQIPPVVAQADVATSTIMKCGDCGFELPISAAFCPNCGHSVAPAS